MIGMGMREEGTQVVKVIDKKTKGKLKKEEKTKEKSKKGIADHVSGNWADEAHMAVDSRKGEKEGKKTKKKGVKNGVGTEECNDHFGERDENECGEESEILSQKSPVSSVIEKVRGKMKEQSIGISDNMTTKDDINMTTKDNSEVQNGTDDAALGQGLEKNVVGSGHKMTKRTIKRSVKNLGFGAENMDAALLTEQEIFETSSQQGESVEAFGEGMIKKEEKRKRKKDKCTGHGRTVSEGGAQGQDLNDPKCKRLSTFNERDDNELLTNLTVDAIAQRCAVTKDDQKRKRRSKKSKGESGSGADLELNDGTNDEVLKDHRPKTKKVSFSGKDEVFQLHGDKLVRGKRFSKEEDEMVKQAVFKYIETYYLGEEGLQMVLNCISHPKIRNCWKEIGKSLPHRPQVAVYNRAHVLFRRAEKRKWTKEEIEMLRASHKKHGNHWRAVADELGKHDRHVANMWRYISHANVKKGPWSQDEYQSLFDLVNVDLRTRYAEEKKSKYGMLRDNLPWNSISDRMTTRAASNICLKWYRVLTSHMVTDGDWADSDDYRLIDALSELDASCYEDVDWDSLVEHRSGVTCQKRWSEMALHIGDNSKRSFADQVEVLAKRYCPELLEDSKNWESKPVVP